MNTALIADPTRSRQIMERIPAGRWGAPSDFEGVVVFLASKASDYVCGDTITVDGGWMAREYFSSRRCCSLEDIASTRLDGKSSGPYMRILLTVTTRYLQDDTFGRACYLDRHILHFSQISRFSLYLLRTRAVMKYLSVGN